MDEDDREVEKRKRKRERERVSECVSVDGCLSDGYILYKFLYCINF